MKIQSEIVPWVFFFFFHSNTRLYNILKQIFSSHHDNQQKTYFQTFSTGKLMKKLSGKKGEKIHTIYLELNVFIAAFLLLENENRTEATGLTFFIHKYV